MIKTTMVGYGEKGLKLMKNYITNLDEQLSTYYPAISWCVYDMMNKDAELMGLYEHLHEKVLTYHPNLVFINLSAKDTDMGSSHFLGLTQYEILLKKLLAEISTHNNRTGLNHCRPIPVIITPPPVNEVITGINCTNNRLKQYNYVVKECVKEVQGVVIDLYEAIASKVHPEVYLAEDGRNLSQKGQDLLYDLVFIELTKLINFQGVLKER